MGTVRFTHICRVAVLAVCLTARSALALEVETKEAQAVGPVGMASSYHGGMGLIHVVSPIVMPKTTFSLLGHGRYFTAKDFLAKDLHVKHMETGVAVAASVNDYWEVYFGGLSSSHLINNALIDSNTLIQSVGDYIVGFKVGYKFKPIFYGGIKADALFRTKRGGLGPDFSATTPGFGLLMALDWTGRAAEPKPVRLTWNFGYTQDRTSKLLSAGSQGDPSTNFGLGIPWDDNVFTGGFALEIPQKFMDIFLEYSTEQYIDINKSSAIELPTGQQRVLKRKFIENPQRFTPGLRIFPTRSINIDLASELGSPLLFSKAQYDIYQLGYLEEIMPKWLVHAGIGYTFYPPDPVLPKEGFIIGTVYDKKTQQPIRTAILSFPGTQFSSIITDKDGKYRSYSFEQGPVRIDVGKKGYVSATTTAVAKAGGDVVQDFYLGTEEEKGSLMVVVIDNQGHPVSSATVQFQEGTIPSLRPDPASGMVETTLAPGVYTLVAVAAGYEPKSQKVRVADQKSTKVSFTLTPEQQVGTLDGRVENLVGEPLGAVIAVKETGSNIASDPVNGMYSSKLSVGQYTIKASVAGYVPQEKIVQIEKDRTTTANFVLEEAKKSGKIKGRVVDDKTSKGLFAVISFPNGEKGNVASDPESGEFMIDLDAGRYQLKAGSSAYQSKVVEVEVRSKDTVEITIPLTAYQKVAITQQEIQIRETIKFKPNKAVILIDSYSVLDEVAVVMKSNPEYKIAIEGHTDSDGAAVANRNLSQSRAEAVREYLMSRGIAGDRMRAIGYGEDRPITDNNSPEGKAKNRRVAFKILDANGNVQGQ